MNTKTLHISVVDCVATYQKRDGDIVCGNKTKYEIKFTFDAEWDAYTVKTARFIWNGGYLDVSFTGDLCIVPAIYGADQVEVGVYVGESIHTTTGAIIPAKRSILCSGGTSHPESSGGGDASGGSNVILDTTLTLAGCAADARAVGERLAELEDRIGEGGGSGGGSVDSDLADRLAKLEADFNYTEIAITSLTASPKTIEVGWAGRIDFAWKTNKVPTELRWLGAVIDATKTSTYITKYADGKPSKNSYSLSATDERGKTVSKNVDVNSYYGVYYGVAAAKSSYDSAFILGLTKSLQSSRATSFTANAGSGQYIYFCAPASFGSCTFKVGGFEGGFSLVKTISFKNTYGVEVNYNIYRSDNASLGSTSVAVS